MFIFGDKNQSVHYTHNISKYTALYIIEFQCLKFENLSLSILHNTARHLCMHVYSHQILIMNFAHINGNYKNLSKAVLMTCHYDKRGNLKEINTYLLIFSPSLLNL